MRGSTTSEKFIYWLFADRIPLTKILIIVNVLTFLLVLFKVRSVYYLAFEATLARAMPWTFFTFPLVGVCCSPINLLFQGYWMWVAGGSLERSWGTCRFAIFFFAASAVTALGLFLGSMFVGAGASALGLWLPLAAVTVAFGMLNPEQTILFFFIIPLKLKYLAMISAALVFISFAANNILLGFFALSGCAFAYWYVTKERFAGYSRPRIESRGNVIHLHRKPSLLQRLNPIRWYKDYRERKRLRKLLGR